MPMVKADADAADHAPATTSDTKMTGINGHLFISRLYV